jgi:signal peptide peptidase SppA
LKNLVLMSACQRRYLAPSHSFVTALPHAEPFFFASALKKWGIRVEVHTAGEFKSAGEAFSRDSMSPAAKANLEELLDARREGILSGIRTCDGSTESEANKLHKAISERAFLESEELFKLKFCHGLLAASSFRDLCEDLIPYWESGLPLPIESDQKASNSTRGLLALMQLEGFSVKDAPVTHSFPGIAETSVEGLLAQQSAEAKDNHTNSENGTVSKESEAPSKGDKDEAKNSLNKARQAEKEERKKLRRVRILEADQADRRFRRQKFRPFRIRRYPSVALVSCEGMIMWGEEQPESGRIGALSMRGVFRELEDSRHRAIFLYINSPGGLSDASEALYQDIYRLSRTKPVFAIIGPVAASGGYYMACAANRIYSPDLSLTGSVGVIRMRPELSGLYRQIGVKKQRIRFGPTTDVLSEVGKLSAKSQALLDESMDRAYSLFLDRVGRNRGLNRRQTDERGRGKVYTGARFRARGMIDGSGGFIEAFRDFRKEAGFNEDQSFDIQIYPVLKPSASDLLRQGPSFSSSHALQDLFSGQNLFLMDGALLPAAHVQSLVAAFAGRL